MGAEGVGVMEYFFFSPSVCSSCRVWDALSVAVALSAKSCVCPHNSEIVHSGTGDKAVGFVEFWVVGAGLVGVVAEVIILTFPGFKRPSVCSRET